MVTLQRNSKGMQPFSAKEWLKFIVIDILGQMLATKRENLFMLVISNEFSKLVKIILSTIISVGAVAKGVPDNWVLVYEPPK